MPSFPTTSIKWVSTFLILMMAPAFLCSCSNYKRLSDDEKTLLLLQLQTPQETSARVEAQLRIESSEFTGEFIAALAFNRKPTPQVRLQLFTELGTKVLDLSAHPEQLIGRFATADRSEDSSTSAEAKSLSLRWKSGEPLPLSFLSFLGITLVESCIYPKHSDAIAQSRSTSDILLLQPSEFPSFVVRRNFDGSGLPLSMDISGRWVHWSIHYANGQPASIVAPGFSATIEIIDIETSSEVLPNALFQMPAKAADVQPEKSE